MPSRPAIWRRLLPLAALLLMGGLIAAAITLQPQWQAWRRSRLVDRLAAAAHASDDDRQVRRLVSQLGRLTPDSIEALATFAASERSAAAQPAQAAIDLLTGQWELRRERPLDGAQERQMQRLAETLASEIDRFGPIGRQWAESILLQLIDASEQMTPLGAAALLAACDRALSRLPAPTDPRRVVPSTTMPAPTTIALPTPSVDVARLAVMESQPVARWLPSSPSASTPDAPPARTPAVAMNRLPRRNASTSLAWQPRDAARPLPTETDAASSEQSSPQSVAVTPTPEQVVSTEPTPINVPSPQLIRRLAREYRSLPTTELEAIQETANRYVQRLVIAELDARRVARGSRRLDTTINLPPDSAYERIRSAQLLPASEARRELRRLVNDPDPQVRFEALTALATTNDPLLDQIARQRAVSDNDAGVARLASEILDRLQR